MKFHASALALGLFLGACQGGDTTPGVVPPDLRDVERAGEGLVATTFGAPPARTPDWGRAGMVLSILKGVWARSKTQNPGLPEAQVKQVDAAIVTLDRSITARQQKDAAYAANAVGLAVPFFDYFHPDAPPEVVRMDAMFRQLGLDGHYGDWAAVEMDRASLQADWTSSRDRVHARVPTCHRVGGTSTVEGEIDASLAASAKAVPAKDTMTVEQESENGALEIDTLELLFDCPPDSVMPANGLGAKCATRSDCDAGQVCDLGNAGGRCAPDGAHAAVGTPCTNTIECGNDPRSACFNEAGDGYPGGYCSLEPCDDIQVCPPGATCVAIGGETPACFKTCTTDADCRTKEGYVCQLFLTVSPSGFGPSDHACAFPCKRDTDCKSPLTCDVGLGKCRP